MCGVIGIATRSADPNAVTEDRFRGALARIGHRGPDGSGIYRDKNLWLGHARLSILDLSNAGSQPMESADHRFVIAYNGEIYNFRELAAERHMNDLRSSSDTEVVLRVFAQLGVASLPRFNGMYAFAVYDRRRRKLWLVRDRTGIKPMYYRISARDSRSPRRSRPSSPWIDRSRSATWRHCTNGCTTAIRWAAAPFTPASSNCGRGTVWSSISIHSSTAFAEYHSFRRRPVRRFAHRSTAGTRRSNKPAARAGGEAPTGERRARRRIFVGRHRFERHHGLRLPPLPGRLATYSVGFDFVGDANELPVAKRTADRFGTDHHEIHIVGADVPSVVEKTGLPP